MDRRIYGLENEYGVTCTLRGQRRLSPDEVARYLFRRVVSWGRSSNVFLANGARLYLDVGSHPEYATPECDSLHDLVAHDKAGEWILEQLVQSAEQRLAEEGIRGDIYLFRNNTDSAGNSYGCHENYLTSRRDDFASYAEVLIPFLVSRQIYAGAGKVLQTARGAMYCISQRAEHIWEGVSSATTRSRPIINTRDEPHADPRRWRRLHLIVGDANCFETATYLKLGMTSLVLWLVERAEVEGPPRGTAEALARIDALALADPVAATHEVSRDLALTRRLELVDGRRLTAIEIQREYLEAVRSLGEPAEQDTETADVLRRWGSLLDRLETEPAACVREVEWLAKLRVLEGLRRRDRLEWDDPRLAAVDLQWSDLRPERSVHGRLVRAGAVEQLVDEAEVERAVVEPPTTTRAFFRGRSIARFGAHVSSASWDSLVFDVPGAPTLRRVPMPDPLRGTASHVAELLESSASAGELLEALGG